MLYYSAITPQWYNQSRVVCCAPKPATATARRAIQSSPQLWPSSRIPYIPAAVPLYSRLFEDVPKIATTLRL